MKKVIVTGANGFIGSNVVKELISNNIEVLAIDLPNNNKNIPVDKRVSFLGADVFNIDELTSRIDKDTYDTIFHFAWVGSAGNARVDSELQLKNALMNVEFIKMAKQIGAKRFVCAGSIMEKEVVAALNAQGNLPGMGYIYGIGKLTAHCLCKSVAANEGIELIWAIITNAYGEGEVSPRFINTTIRKIINGDRLEFTAATQGYDFVHVTDVARAFRLIGEKGKPFYEYVIGSGNARPLKEFIIELRDTLAPDAALNFGDIPYTGVDMPLECFSIKQINEHCGFTPQISFSEGVKRTMSWLMEE